MDQRGGYTQNHEGIPSWPASPPRSGRHGGLHPPGRARRRQRRCGPVRTVLHPRTARLERRRHRLRYVHGRQKGTPSPTGRRPRRSKAGGGHVHPGGPSTPPTDPGHEDDHDTDGEAPAAAPAPEAAPAAPTRRRHPPPPPRPRRPRPRLRPRRTSPPSPRADRAGADRHRRQGRQPCPASRRGHRPRRRYRPRRLAAQAAQPELKRR